MDDNTTPPPSQPVSDPVPPTTTTAYPTQTFAAKPGDATADDRSQALIMWVLTIFLNFIAPIIFLIVAKDKPFVYRHTAQALTLSIITAVTMFILIITLIGALLLPIVGLLQLAVCIWGAIQANNGMQIEIPVVSGLAKSMFKV
jgi:uncharacterized protein